MNRIFTKRLAVTAAAALLACSAFAASNVPTGGGSRGDAAVDKTTGASYVPQATQQGPVIPNWAAPQFFNPAHGVSGSMAGLVNPGITAKNSLALATFIPIAPCRLVDTRGLFSPVYAGGAFAAGETRVYRASGNCGVPAGNSRVKAVSLAVTTPPTAASGDIEVLSESATLGGTVVMVIQASQWNSATTVTAVDTEGDFKVQLRGTSGHVVIDINGFYAGTNSSTTNDDFISIVGAYDAGGGLLFIQNTSASGAAINALNTGGGSQAMIASDDAALHIVDGSIRVQGAGLGSNTAAFVHTVNTATDLCPNPDYARLTNPMLNLQTNVLLFVTGTGGVGGGTTSSGPGGEPVAVYYSAGCNPAGGWNIYSPTGFANGARFNVLVIKP